VKWAIRCAAAISAIALLAGTLGAQGTASTRGSIASVTGDRIYVAIGNERVCVLEMIQPCPWCQEGVSVIVRPVGPVTVTLEPETSPPVSRVRKVKAFVIHDAPL
jgi:hypothetical protein